MPGPFTKKPSAVYTPPVSMRGVNALEGPEAGGFDFGNIAATILEDASNEVSTYKDRFGRTRPSNFQEPVVEEPPRQYPERPELVDRHPPGVDSAQELPGDTGGEVEAETWEEWSPATSSDFRDVGQRDPGRHPPVLLGMEDGTKPELPGVGAAAAPTGDRYTGQMEDRTDAGSRASMDAQRLAEEIPGTIGGKEPWGTGPAGAPMVPENLQETDWRLEDSAAETWGPGPTGPVPGSKPELPGMGGSDVHPETMTFEEETGPAVKPSGWKWRDPAKASENVPSQETKHGFFAKDYAEEGLEKPIEVGSTDWLRRQYRWARNMPEEMLDRAIKDPDFFRFLDGQEPVGDSEEVTVDVQEETGKAPIEEVNVMGTGEIQPIVNDLVSRVKAAQKESLRARMLFRDVDLDRFAAGNYDREDVYRLYKLLGEHKETIVKEYPELWESFMKIVESVR